MRSRSSFVPVVLRVLAALAVLPAAACLEIDDPVVMRVTPTQGQVGTEVLIEGERFIETFSRTRILFGGTTAPPNNILELTDRRIRVLVPAGAATGDLVVSVGGVESLRSPFTVFGDWIAVGSDGSATVHLFDSVTGLIEGIVPAQAAVSLARFSPGGTEAWLLSEGEGGAVAERLVSPDRTIDTALAINRSPSSIAYDPVPPDLTDDPDEPLRVEAWVLSSADPVLEVIRSEIAERDLDPDDDEVPADPVRDVRARVELPSPARDLAFAPDGSVAYMIEPARSALLVVDADIPVPFGLAETPIDPEAGPIVVSPSNGMAYVLEQNPAQVTEISSEDFTVTRSFPVGRAPSDVLLSGDLLFVSSPADGVIDVWDVGADEEEGESPELGEIVANGAPRDLALLPTIDGTFLYCLVETDGVVRVRAFDPLTFAEVGVRAIEPEPTSLEPVLSASGSYLYLTHAGAPGLVTILEEPNGFVRTVRLDDGARFLDQQP